MSDVPHVRIPERACPYCGKGLDSVSMLEGDVPPPSKGDMAVCFGCAEIMQFGDGLTMEKMSADELAALSLDEMADIRKTQGAIRAFLNGEVDVRASYHDDRFAERKCDHCGRAYQGPAVYCSFECAIDDL